MGRKKNKDAGPRVVVVPPKYRFTSTYYSEEECKLAIDGKQIPQALGRKVTQRCVIRGIRKHPGFATELDGSLPCFTRALNARRIMSGIIPDMQQEIEFPYCIWYPDVASEDTYRKLAKRYPSMKYQVGRACAVAGYTELYGELHLLPDTHIAEEARDNGSKPIFEYIMAHKDKFDIMDDFARSVNEDVSTVRHSPLNGETAVRSSLDIRREFGEITDPWASSSEDKVFDITEDFGVDTTSSMPLALIRARKLAVEYLYTPLPIDLPPLQKDLLILAAAYHGDIDRYSRLRYRDRMIGSEIDCVARGIHHHTFFAKWWANQLQHQMHPFHKTIEEAIAARAIMDNDLSRILPTTPAPQLIWYPRVPELGTLELLHAIRPDMTEQVARACDVGDYQQLYSTVDPAAHSGLLAEAKASANPYYLQDQQSKAAAATAAGSPWRSEPKPWEIWQLYTKAKVFDADISILTTREVRGYGVGGDPDSRPDCVGSDFSIWELKASVAADDRDGDEIRRATLWPKFEEMLAQEGRVHLSMEYAEEAKQIVERQSEGSGESHAS